MHPQFAGDTSFRERFKREAEVAMRVSGPFTAKVVDSGVDDRTPWLATEYIPGPTLAQLVTEHGPLQRPQRARLQLLAPEAAGRVEQVQVNLGRHGRTLTVGSVARQ